MIQELRPKLSQIPGINAYLQIPPTIRIGGSLTKSAIPVHSAESGYGGAVCQPPKFEGALRQLPQLQDVTSDLQVNNPQLTVQVDHDKAHALGVTPDQISQCALFGLRYAAGQARSTRQTMSTT